MRWLGAGDDAEKENDAEPESKQQSLHVTPK